MSKALTDYSQAVQAIGRGIVETLSGHRSPAVLMRNHGPFTIGKDARAAVKAAVMVEEVARTVHVSRQLGEPVPIEQQHIDSLYDRYQNVYGQPAATPSGTAATDTKNTEGQA
jgi:L-ribulose-5-phosphate 4-epimerase